MTLKVEKDEIDSAVTATPALGQIAFGGAVWTLAQTLGSKFAGIAAQLVTAAILSKAELGQFAQVLFITSLAGVGTQLGIGEILIRRHRRFDRWAEIAFWIGLAAGLTGMLLVMLVAPFSGRIYEESAGLGRLLLVASIGLPFDAVLLVPQAKLKSNLRFKPLALIGTANTVGLAILSVCFAASVKLWPHSPVAGAMALVLPRPIMSATTLLISWYLSGFRLHFQPMLRRWPFVLRDSRYFFFTMIFTSILMQGDYLLGGIFFNRERLGAYYFAFNLSTQTSQLVATNLTSVLLPSFAMLNLEPDRQKAAYLRVCSLIALLGTIVCVAQAFLATPLLHLAFNHKYDDAIPLFQILTIGMVFVLPSSSAMSFLQARGEYRKGMIWTIVVAACFIGSVWLGAETGNIRNIAVADAIFYGVFGPAGTMLPLGWRFPQTLKWIWQIYSFPLAVGSVAAGIAFSFVYFLPQQNELVAATSGCIVAAAFYAALAFLWRRQEIQEVILRVAPALRRRRMI